MFFLWPVQIHYLKTQDFCIACPSPAGEIEKTTFCMPSFQIVLNSWIVSVKCEESEYVFYPLTRPTSKNFSYLYQANEEATRSVYYCHQKYPVKNT
jgi:hypothetical protein